MVTELLLKERNELFAQTADEQKKYYQEQASSPVHPGGEVIGPSGLDRVNSLVLTGVRA
jgi:hypothetical protein